MIKVCLLQSLSPKTQLDVLCLTEICLKPDDYITLNESTPL